MNIDKRAIIAEIEGYVGSKLNLLLKLETAWQPTDFVPDLRSDNWVADLTQFRAAAQELPDDLLVVLVGAMVTEEALPSYQTFLNRLDGLRDDSGVSSSAWAQWSRGWTSEENRHGDLLNRYLYLTGRVDMHAVEVTIQHLIRNGFNPGTGDDPYMGLVYTSFQERATRISHNRVGQLAKRAGDSALAKICNVIAGDEARHEEAYRCFMGRVYELDPSGAVLAFNQMLNQRIVMPASLMSDGDDNDLFSNFSALAQQLGVYTFTDYIEILEHLISTWNVAKLSGLSGPAAAAQDRICRLPELYRRRMARMENKPIAREKMNYGWVSNRPV